MKRDFKNQPAQKTYIKCGHCKKRVYTNIVVPPGTWLGFADKGGHTDKKRRGVFFKVKCPFCDLEKTYPANLFHFGNMQCIGDRLDENLKSIFANELDKLMAEWVERTKKCVLNKEWWHQKFYQRRSERNANDGYVEQNFKLRNETKTEAPYSRGLFYSTNGRFSLPKEKPVAYFSDWLTGTCESSPAFRDNPNLTSAELVQYMEGKFDPDPKDNQLCGYPRAYFLHPKAKILDVSKPDVALFRLLKNSDASFNRFYSETILNRDISVYSQTRSIAVFAEQNGFDGILYRSVRIPEDWNFTGGNNLVLFKDEIQGSDIVVKTTERLFNK